MFKKLKDKLAEEVKSSPQRIQQFAHAAQAAVTSASSSISDITNNDLFSIGDSDVQHKPTGNQAPSNVRPNTDQLQKVSQGQPTSSSGSAELLDYSSSGHDTIEHVRQRRLSNSSFASDVSFRLPSYDSPSMYHLQSDMEVSASEAEERSFSSGTVSLERVTKEQLYAAYRRTQERYSKYRTQYADLARHYKLLERENAKAKSVLVETQDKALRRISELREQCALEQSAKAHLEKALRVDIEERNMKIETLNTKIQILQSQNGVAHETPDDNTVQLINLGPDKENNLNVNALQSEISLLNSKIEKLEQLQNKYKESLKTTKDKNSQITTELQIMSNELETKKKELENYNDAKAKIQELMDINEDLQNKLNSYDFSKTKELSTLETDLQKSQQEIAELQSKVKVFSKKEEEYAISLAENKLSIHKELESKEAEIKSLKDNLSDDKKEIQSMNIVLNDYKNKISSLEQEQSKLQSNLIEYDLAKTKINELESQIREISQKCQLIEQKNIKLDEELKCLQLQLKQETAEKLAMIDRNLYLENKNTLLGEENTKKSSQINALEKQLDTMKKEIEDISNLDKSNDNLNEEIKVWKAKYNTLESEIQEERIELVKLQAEIEKMLTNHELAQKENEKLQIDIEKINNENFNLKKTLSNVEDLKKLYERMRKSVLVLKEDAATTVHDIKVLKLNCQDNISVVQDFLNQLIENFVSKADYELILRHNEDIQNEMNSSKSLLSEELNVLSAENSILKSKIVKYESESSLVNEKIRNISSEYENTLDKLAMEKDHVIKKCKELESGYHYLHDNLEKLKEEKTQLTSQIATLEAEKDNAAESNNTLLEENNLLKTQNDAFSYEFKKLEKKHNDIIRIEENMKKLEQENITLKGEFQRFVDNVNVLETELLDVRKSHTVIENEKEHLTSVILNLEAKEKQRQQTASSKDTQTEDALKEEVISQVESPLEISNHHKSLHKDDLQNEIKELKRQLVDMEEHSKIHTDKQNSEKEILTEENTRLKSDIEGLQVYLSKISKENSELNDRLRELFASSEVSVDKNYTSDELAQLKNEVKIGKDKVDELLRENSILLEENLELKDQIYPKENVESVKDSQKLSGNYQDLDILKNKYNALEQSKLDLEQQVNELELINKSMNGNAQQVQDKNEKLKRANEKLERRLDEALVSLRHLHSLQENTELEYLKNVLFEYFTGPGTHSITLAKVLSAVVKFDETQTHAVLQKEKERQGLLRQLGLL